MRRVSYLPLFGAIVLLSVVFAQAQIAMSAEAESGVAADSSVDHVAYVDRIAYLEGQMASIESTLENRKSTDTCTSCCRRACCGCPGIVGGYDFLVLAPHFSNGVSYQLLENVAPVSVWTQHGYPTDYEMAPRFWLGYVGSNGLGVRARYMQYDHDASFTFL